MIGDFGQPVPTMIPQQTPELILQDVLAEIPAYVEPAPLEEYGTGGEIPYNDDTGWTPSDLWAANYYTQVLPMQQQTMQQATQGRRQQAMRAMMQQQQQHQKQQRKQGGMGWGKIALVGAVVLGAVCLLKK